MSTKSRCTGLLAALALVAATASDARTLLITDDQLTPETFPEAAALIRESLPVIPPQHLSNARRNQVERGLLEIERLLADGPGRHRDALRALQVRVNRALGPAITRESGQSPMVCKRIKPVGSRIVTVQCLSREDREIEQWRARDFMAKPVIPTIRQGPMARVRVD